MCLLAVMFRVVNGADVVIGANREEAYARGGEPPAIREGRIPFVAGIDPVAGGTWLGINATGLVVAVTNRRKSIPPTKPHSRGLLVRTLLAQPGAAEAIDEAQRALSTNEYDGCNILCVDRERATVLHSGDWLRVQPLPSGVHILTNRDVNDLSDARVRFALDRLASREYSTVEQSMSAMRLLCASREEPTPICLHGSERGTVSSTLVALGPTWQESELMHAQGSPDRAGYQDCSGLLHQLMTHSR